MEALLGALTCLGRGGTMAEVASLAFEWRSLCYPDQCGSCLRCAVRILGQRRAGTTAMGEAIIVAAGMMAVAALAWLASRRWEL